MNKDKKIQIWGRWTISFETYVFGKFEGYFIQHVQFLIENSVFYNKSQNEFRSTTSFWNLERGSQRAGSRFPSFFWLHFIASCCLIFGFLPINLFWKIEIEIHVEIAHRSIDANVRRPCMDNCLRFDQKVHHFSLGRPDYLSLTSSILSESCSSFSCL